MTHRRRLSIAPISRRRRAQRPVTGRRRKLLQRGGLRPAVPLDPDVAGPSQGSALPGGRSLCDARDSRIARTARASAGMTELRTAWTVAGVGFRRVRLPEVESARRRGGAGDRAADHPAARLPGILVRLAPPVRTTGGGRPPCDRAGPARLRPQRQAVRDRRLSSGPAGGGRDRARGCVWRSAVRLVGHDWGGLVAWWAASRYPERIERLADPQRAASAVVGDYMRHHPGQLLRSTYVGLFQLPRLPERLLTADRCRALRRALPARAGPVPSRRPISTGTSRRGCSPAP